jgi:hypothetical protein
VIREPCGRGGHSLCWAAEPEKIIIVIIMHGINSKIEHNLNIHDSQNPKFVDYLQSLSLLLGWIIHN